MPGFPEPIRPPPRAKPAKRDPNGNPVPKIHGREWRGGSQPSHFPFVVPFFFLRRFVRPLSAAAPAPTTAPAAGPTTTLAPTAVPRPVQRTAGTAPFNDGGGGKYCTPEYWTILSSQYCAILCNTLHTAMRRCDAQGTVGTVSVNVIRIPTPPCRCPLRAVAPRPVCLNLVSPRK